MSDFNAGMIDAFHRTRGQPSQDGRPILLLHCIGAKTGNERTVPLMFHRDANGPWYVFASYAGAPRHPAWYLNVVANPEFDISVGNGQSIDRVPVRARVLEGEERASIYATQSRNWPQFADYAKKTTREFIPVVELTRR